MGVGLGLCTGNSTSANAKYLLVREGAENDPVHQCTFVHAAAYCHTRDATQRCQFSEFAEMRHPVFQAVLYFQLKCLKDGIFYCIFLILGHAVA